MNRDVESHPVITIEGVPFAALNLHDTASHILRQHAQGHGGWVVTPNLDILRRLQQDREFSKLVREQASLFTADGKPIIWLSRLLGTPLPERVTGSDLLVELTCQAANQHVSIFLLGGNPGAAESAAQKLKEQFTSLHIAGWHCPPFGFENNPQEMATIRERLSATRPDIIFVGLGSPKQEHLIASLRNDLPASWWLGIGVSFSFIAGDVKRAPRWMQQYGLEWAWRILQEPGRLFRRYVVHGIPFAIKLFARTLAIRVATLTHIRRGA